jgi:hypothetical protein
MIKVRVKYLVDLLLMVKIQYIHLYRLFTTVYESSPWVLHSNPLPYYHHLLVKAGSETESQLPKQQAPTSKQFWLDSILFPLGSQHARLSGYTASLVTHLLIFICCYTL